MENELKEIEVTITELDAIIKEAADLEKLYVNKLFNKIIVKGYFEDEAVRMVGLKGTISHPDPAMQKYSMDKLDNSIIGIGALRKYLSTIMIMGNDAREKKHNYELAKEEILATPDAAED